MPQHGLLYLAVAVPLNLPPGGNTPLESMPLLRNLMQLSPATHFVAVAQAVLYRGAGFDLVWPLFLATSAIGGVFLALSVSRFRSVSGQNLSNRPADLFWRLLSWRVGANAPPSRDRKRL